MMNLLLADIEIAARTIWQEARGESYEGKLAVAYVLFNRWKSTKGQFSRDDTLATTCLRHLQFSGWTLDDPNFEKAFKVDLSDKNLRECFRAVLEACDNPTDITYGSKHYHANYATPYWAVSHKPVAKVGNHLFYNDVD